MNIKLQHINNTALEFKNFLKDNNVKLFQSDLREWLCSREIRKETEDVLPDKISIIEICNTLYLIPMIIISTAKSLFKDKAVNSMELAINASHWTYDNGSDRITYSLTIFIPENNWTICSVINFKNKDNYPEILSEDLEDVIPNYCNKDFYSKALGNKFEALTDKVSLYEAVETIWRKICTP